MIIYIGQHTKLWILVISLKSKSNGHKMMSLHVAFQVTIVLLCVWLIFFTVFSLPFILEKIANLIDRHDKELTFQR
jgi:hypothetical protein